MQLIWIVLIQAPDYVIDLLCTFFQVTVGFLYEQYTVGYLDYQSMWQSTEFYIGIGVVAAAILIIIIVAVICCKARDWNLTAKSMKMSVILMQSIS